MIQFDGTFSHSLQLSYVDDHHMSTPFTAVGSVSLASRWQKRSSQYKEDHLQQKKGRRQRNRSAISLLTISLPLEFRGSGIRPFNEEVRKLSWWASRGT